MSCCIFLPAIDETFGSAIHASALDEEEEDDDDEEIGEGRDDERSGTRYNVWTLSYLDRPGRSDSLLTAVLLVPCHLRDRYDVRGNAIDRLVRIYFTLVTCGPTLNNLSHRNVVSKTITPSDSDEVVYIGRS